MYNFTGVGVYISRIEEGSLAERAGLRPGDTILEVNGTPFTSISHDEALKVCVFVEAQFSRVGGGSMYRGCNTSRNGKLRSCWRLFNACHFFFFSCACKWFVFKRAAGYMVNIWLCESDSVRLTLISFVVKVQDCTAEPLFLMSCSL